MRLNFGLALFVPVMLFASPAMSLQITTHAILYDPTTQQAHFTLGFDSPPDFQTVDQYGRQAADFQFHLDYNALDPWNLIMTNFSALARGSAISQSGEIRFQDREGEGGPGSGGWGPLRGAVAYELNGTILTFSAPLTFVGDDDGLFGYALYIYSYGVTLDARVGYSISGPVSASTSSWGRLKLYLRE